MRLKALKCKTKTEFLYFSVYFFRFQGQNFLTESKGSEIVAYGRQPVMGAVAPREPLCLRAMPAPDAFVPLLDISPFQSWIFQAHPGKTVPLWQDTEK